jgi:hypothetical protein
VGACVGVWEREGVPTWDGDAPRLRVCERLSDDLCDSVGDCEAEAEPVPVPEEDGGVSCDEVELGEPACVVVPVGDAERADDGEPVCEGVRVCERVVLPEVVRVCDGEADADGGIAAMIRISWFW